VIRSHLLTLVIFGALTSTVFATLLRDDVKSQVRFGLKVFGAFVGSAILAGWLMAPFPN
jgi:hypothetical protein